MAKTNPIGVRFDAKLLEMLINSNLVKSPQTALNLYERSYLELISQRMEANPDKKDIEIFKVGEDKLSDILIYKLINPIDNSVFYIGRTCDSLKRRLMMHISSSKPTVTTEHLNYRRIAIIKAILDENKKPIIELIETITPQSTDEYNGHHPRENFWIAEYIKQGHPLTNRIIAEVKNLFPKENAIHEPKEGSMAFFKKYGVPTYAEIKKED